MPIFRCRSRRAFPTAASTPANPSAAILISSNIPKATGSIDSPRFVEHLARRFADLGGIRYIFLTHRDDVADADKYAARFGATRIIHRLERSAQPDAERLLDGFDPIELAPGFLAIPTPGHTRGHCALLYKNEFLFAGDHMWWSRVRRRLNASQDVCWYSWRDQVNSVALLDALLVRVGAPRPRRARAFPARRDEAPGNKVDRRRPRRVNLVAYAIDFHPVT